MAEDEPICIGTLMNLPLSQIVAVEATAQARMGRFWELIADKYGGIPQQILAFEQPKLTQRGKRWAPKIPTYQLTTATRILSLPEYSTGPIPFLASQLMLVSS